MTKTITDDQGNKYEISPTEIFEAGTRFILKPIEPVEPEENHYEVGPIKWGGENDDAAWFTVKLSPRPTEAEARAVSEFIKAGLEYINEPSDLDNDLNIKYLTQTADKARQAVQKTREPKLRLTLRRKSITLLSEGERWST